MLNNDKDCARFKFFELKPKYQRLRLVLMDVKAQFLLIRAEAPAGIF